MSGKETMSAEQLYIASTVLSRLGLAGKLGNQTFQGHRKLYTVLGYPQVLSFDDYLVQYDREDIASRLIKFPAQETWKVPPEVRDGEEFKTADGETNFVKDWNALVKRLKIWHFLQRVDKLAGIGRFGILLLGTGKGDLNTKVSGKTKLIYLQPFTEDSAQVKDIDSNDKSPRFGLPETYTIDFGDIQQDGDKKKKRQRDTSNQKIVHWSRVIHVAENLDENSIYGEPRLQTVLNRLLDLQKVVGGTGEAIWLLANRGLQFDIREGHGLSPQEEEQLEDQIEEYVHGIRRVLQTAGVDINELGGYVIDPSGAVDILLKLIAGTKEIPLRILLGSERGELASSQDQQNWASVVRARQEQFAEPVILRPLIDWCIRHQVISAPKTGEYVIDWPATYIPSEAEKAQVLKDQTLALKNIQDSLDPWAIVDPQEVRDQISWAEGKREQTPEPPPAKDLEETLGGEGDDQEALPPPETQVHDHASHDYTVINSICPLCGHSKARVYEGHGQNVLCDECLQTYNRALEAIL